jgi:MacB-like periplasmic core domain
VILVGSVVNSVLLRPLPYGGDPAKPMMVRSSTAPHGLRVWRSLKGCGRGAVPASAGRYIEPADDRPESSLVAVIRYRLWRRWYGADAAVLGRTILVDSVPYKVIGVANSRLATADR